ncbi:hypothetical protein VN0434_12110 [Helicobacter pylori]|nr:hypothetical protein VN0434_12110 [Helicobacter pylori]
MQSQFNNALSSNAKYLVHEYLKPSYFLDKATLNKLNETSPIMQEMLKDLFYRSGYKKDYFIKGKTKLEHLQAERELLKLSFIYVSKEISYKWKAMGKTFTMHQHVYEPIFKALKDHSMVSAKEIQDILSAHHNRLVSPISAKGIYLNDLKMDFLYAHMHHIKDSIKWLKSPILNKQSKNCKTRFKILKKTCPG